MLRPATFAYASLVVLGATLLSVGDPADLEIVADLLSDDAVRIGPGTRALVERWGGPARLRAVEPAARTKVSALDIEAQRVDADFALVSPAAARPGLGHGFSVFLRIVEWEADEVLQVPLSAVPRRRGLGRLRRRGRGGPPAARHRRPPQRRRGRDPRRPRPGRPGSRDPNDALDDGTRIVERAALRG